MLGFLKKTQNIKKKKKKEKKCIYDCSGLLVIVKGKISILKLDTLSQSNLNFNQMVHNQYS
jgi:hypothetical protein